MIVLPPIVGVIFFFVCIAVYLIQDARSMARMPYKPIAKPFDDKAFRKANGLPSGPEEVLERYRRRFSRKTH